MSSSAGQRHRFYLPRGGYTDVRNDHDDDDDEKEERQSEKDSDSDYEPSDEDEEDEEPTPPPPAPRPRPAPAAPSPPPIADERKNDESKIDLPALELLDGSPAYVVDGLFELNVDQAVLPPDAKVIVYPEVKVVPPRKPRPGAIHVPQIIPLFQLPYTATDGPQCKTRVVFLDLEVHSSAPSKRISQLSCISLDGSRVFNRYVYWEPLHRDWQQLVTQELVMRDPWDDAKLSQPFYQVMSDLCDAFLPGSVFVYQGNSDYSWLLKNFFLYHGQNESLTQTVLTKMDTMKFRFVSIAAFFADHPCLGSEQRERCDELVKALKLKKSALSSLYDAFFHYSLLYLRDQQRFVYSDAMGKKLAVATQPTGFANIHVDALEDAARKTHSASFYMLYWTNSHLQPIAHYAHCDVQMLRDIVVAWLLFLEIETTSTTAARSDDVFADLMTALVTTRCFFREQHLVAPESVARFLFSRLVPKSQPMTKAVLQLHIRAGAYPSETLKEEVERSTFRAVDLSSNAPHSSLHSLRTWASDASIDRVPPEERMALKLQGRRALLEVRRPTFKRSKGGGWIERADVMRGMMLASNPHLSLPGKLSPFDFNPFVQEAERVSTSVSQWDWDPIVGDRPWYVILSEAGKSFPKTLVLHSRRCVSLVDPLDPDHKRARPAYKSDLYIINFAEVTRTNQWPQLPFYLKFHKECKQHRVMPEDTVPPRAERDPVPMGRSLLDSISHLTPGPPPLNTKNLLKYEPRKSNNPERLRVLASDLPLYKFPRTRQTFKK